MTGKPDLEEAKGDHNFANYPEILYNFSCLYRKCVPEVEHGATLQVFLLRAGTSNSFREANMGKYVAYFLCIVVALIALEYFEIVDVPGFDLPDLQSKGEMIHEKSEENMKRRFGD